MGTRTTCGETQHRGMLRGALLAAIVLAGIAAGLLDRPVRAAEWNIWSGRSGGYQWRWTARDVTASAGTSKPQFSLRRHAIGPGVQDDTVVYECKVRPLSVVGRMLCYRRDDYWEGGAHPSGSVSYGAVDVSKPAKALKLTDLFPDAAVRDALWNDPVVRATLRKAGVTSPGRTAAELVTRLENKSFGGESGDMFLFTGDLLARFALHHLEGDRLAVRLGAAWNAEVYRFQSTELGVMLPVPERLRVALQRAAAGKEGFLMREAKGRFRGASALLFASRPRR